MVHVLVRLTHNRKGFSVLRLMRLKAHNVQIDVLSGEDIWLIASSLGRQTSSHAPSPGFHPTKPGPLALGGLRVRSRAIRSAGPQVVSTFGADHSGWRLIEGKSPDIDQAVLYQGSHLFFGQRRPIIDAQNTFPGFLLGIFHVNDPFLLETVEAAHCILVEAVEDIHGM